MIIHVKSHYRVDKRKKLAKTDFSMTATAFQALIHSSASQTSNILILVCSQFQKRQVRC